MLGEPTNLGLQRKYFLSLVGRYLALGAYAVDFLWTYKYMPSNCVPYTHGKAAEAAKSGEVMIQYDTTITVKYKESQVF